MPGRIPPLPSGEASNISLANSYTDPIILGDSVRRGRRGRRRRRRRRGRGRGKTREMGGSLLPILALSTSPLVGSIQSSNRHQEKEKMWKRITEMIDNII